MPDLIQQGNVNKSRFAGVIKMLFASFFVCLLLVPWRSNRPTGSKSAILVFGFFLCWLEDLQEMKLKFVIRLAMKNRGKLKRAKNYKILSSL